MPVYKKPYNYKAEEIVTPASIVEPVEFYEGMPTPKFRSTHCAIWDTGAEITMVSQKIIDELGLKSVGKSGVMGIGGMEIGETYKIHLGLPNKTIFYNLLVIGSNMEDYDVIIGMDVIAESDFLINGQPDNTVFSFRYPSEGGVELK